MKAGLMYLLAVALGFLMDQTTGQRGYRFYEPEQVQHWALILQITVALAIIPEAYASGFRSSWQRWLSWRFMNLLFWLTVGLAVRAVALYMVADRLHMHNPLAVAGGMLATDPAAVGLALGLVQGQYLAPLFWQLTAESLLNDAIGISVYGVASGQDLSTALTSVGNTIILALGLAGAQTATRLFVRKTWESASAEVFTVMVINLAFVWVGITYHFSLILLTAVSSLTADLFEYYLPRPNKAVDEELHHTWESLSQFGFALILGVVTFLTPWRYIVMEVEVLQAGSILLATVIVSRLAVSFGKRGLWFVFTKRWGREYGLEGAVVNSAAGVPMLGVPAIVALELGGHGDVFAGSSILAAVAFSWIFIPLGVLVIQRSEKYLSRKNGKSLANAEGHQ